MKRLWVLFCAALLMMACGGENKDSLEAPTALALVTATASSITLTWQDNADNEEGFGIEVSTDGGRSFLPLHNTAVDTTTYTHDGLEADTTYHYRVYAYLGARSSGYSNVLEATTDPVGLYSLPADRMTAWNPGITYGGGGIPERATICATVSPAGGDSTSAIQEAIDSCPEGQVVLLTEGTFTCNNYLLLNKSITLRGAGAGRTIIQKTNGATFGSYTPEDYQPNLVIGPNRWPWADDNTSQDFVADGAKGAAAITVADASDFAAGDFVKIDELSNASFRTDPLGRGQIYASDDWRTVWWYHNPGIGSDDPVGGGAEQWFSRPYRVTAETKEIASVSGNTITFTTPLHISYRVANQAQVTGYGGNAHIVRAGVEGMTFTGGSDGSVRFQTAAYAWARNIEIHTWLGHGVAFGDSFRCELRDSYIHDAAWPVPGGGGYAIALSGASAEILIENNISMMANKVIVAQCAGAGSVVGYNYAASARRHTPIG